MTTIAVDGVNEEQFRRSIEGRLRQGKPDVAAERLRALLVPYAGEARILPARFLTVTADDLTLNGWEGLAAAVRRHDRLGHPVTALSIAFAWPGEHAVTPDAAGNLAPHLETSYFTDDAFPFSKSGRDDLLEGYSYHGCTWGDDCEGTDTTLSLIGIDDLHGALAALEARLLASDELDEQGVRAGSLGACLLSVLLFQAVSKRIAQGGLPRPLCVMAGSNGVYPYFDAPVVGLPEEVRMAAEVAEDVVVAGQGIPAPRYSSLLMAGIPRAKKRAVLTLDESESEMVTRLAKLRGINHADEDLAVEPEAPGLPEVAIAPVPDGPLLAKKLGGQTWDFREMLGPREPGPLDFEPPEPAFAPEPPPPVVPVRPAAGPGFTLLEADVQQRLQSLIPPATPTVPQREPVTPITGEPEFPTATPHPIRLGGDIWLEGGDAVPVPEALRHSAYDPIARLRWWTRLRRWFTRPYGR